MAFRFGFEGEGRDGHVFRFGFSATADHAIMQEEESPPETLAPGREFVPELTTEPPSWDYISVRAPAPEADELRSSSSDEGSSDEDDASSTATDVVRGELVIAKARVSQSPSGLQGAASKSDLVPGQYEGGLKLWECAIDLCEHICRRYHVRGHALGDDWEGFDAGEGRAEALQSEALRGKRVLELGCGHALPGIVAAAGGAAEVALQDYNEEVLSAVTRPNVEANLARMPPGGLRPRVRYFAGDWGGLGDLLAVEGGYDLVLAAETVYERAPSLRFLELLKRAVAVEGVALVAAKTYYFGVGGGSREFAGLVREDGFFTCKVAEVLNDGASNMREILELRRKEE